MAKDEAKDAGTQSLPTESPARVWTDDPVATVAADAFNMHRFALALAERIDACEVGQGSVVFGLVGKWGSGKSSVLGMLREELERRGWAIAVFSPWAAPDTRGLEYEFHATLKHALGPEGDDEASPLGGALKKYARAALPLARLVPVGGDAIEGVVSELLSMHSATQPWQVLHDGLAEALSERGKRVLVIADDIDRLDSSELLEFLKVVRLVGRLPNVHHLVAYDGAMVEDLLVQKGFVGGGASYIEKIVQHPFVLPPLSEVTRYEEAEKTVMAVVGQYGLRLDEKDAMRANTLVGVLAELLETPREHLRFREYVLAEAQLIAHTEIDALDFIGVSYLRSEERKVYERLFEWATPDDVRAWSRTFQVDEKAPPTDYLALLEPLCTSGNAEPVLELLSFLLPHVKASYASSHQDHTKAFSDKAYRHRYRLLGVPMDDYADADVEAAVRDLENGDGGSMVVAQIAQALDGASGARAEVIISKLVGARREAPSTSEGLLDFFFERLDAQQTGEPQRGFGSDRVWMLAAWELRRAFEQGLVTAEDLATRVDRKTALRLLQAVRRFSRLDTKEEVPALVEASKYYLARVTDEPEAFLGPEGGLRFTLDMVATVLGPTAIEGVLDRYVGGDAARFVRVAEEFAMEQRFTDGHNWTVEWAFAGDLFASALGEETRGAHAEVFATGEADRLVPVDENDATAIASRETTKRGVAASQDVSE